MSVHKSASSNGVEPPKIVVLGAGPTGLGAALGLMMNQYAGQVSVIEKKAHPGGLAGSFQWKEHSIDYGPHRISPNLPIIQVLVDEMLGLDKLVKKNKNGVHYNRNIYQFPIRISDWIRFTSFLQLCCFAASFLWAKISWIPNRFRTDNFESTIVRKFGQRFFNAIARPMTEKVWGHTQQIDPNFVNQRFASIHPWQVLKKMIIPQQELHPSTFFYPRKGSAQFWECIARTCEHEAQALYYNATPTRIDIENHRIIRVVFQNQDGEQVIEGPNLTVIATIPIVSLLHVLNGFDTKALLEQASLIKIQSMFLVVMEFDQERVLPFRSIQFPEESFWFNRLVEQNEYSRDTVAPGKSVVIADVTYPRGSSDKDLTDEAIIERVKRDCKKLSYLNMRTFKEAIVKRIEFAYVTPDLETRKSIFAIQHGLKQISGLELLGRFAIGEYDNSDYAIDQGVLLARMLSGRLSRLEYLCELQSTRQRSIVV